MFSCSSALNAFITLTPANVSVNLPVTSALIFPRFLNTGRMYLKAFKATIPNNESGTKTNKVIQAFNFIKITKETIAVKEPPTS